jgi:sugar lactone lactonase YvrE
MRQAEPELLVDERFDHPEGIVWNQRLEELAWVDVFRGQVIFYHCGDERVRRLTVGRPVGSVAPRRAGGLVCAVREGFGVISEVGTLEMVASPLSGKTNLQMNDGGVDPYGRFWAGSMTLDGDAGPAEGALYCLNPDEQTVDEKLSGIGVSNGIGWSADGTRCYYVDSATKRLDQFTFALGRGALGKRSPLAVIEGGYPDGLAVDVDDCVWVAISGGWEVRRFTPSGKVDRVIGFPGSQVTTCTFGGPDLKTLFVAVSQYGLEEDARRDQKAGFVFAVDPGVQGLAMAEFGTRENAAG